MLLGIHMNIEIVNKLDEITNIIHSDKELLEMKNRTNNAVLPEVHIVDMRQELLNGNKDIISKKIESDMVKASENLNFEKAIELKGMLNDINITLSKQRIDLNSRDNIDIFGYYAQDNLLSIQKLLCLWIKYR